MPQTPAAPEPAATPMPPRHVFVYGTLRRGDDNDINRLQPLPAFIGMARIEGAMHHLGAYPGVRLQPGGQVLGEVYAIAPGVEQRLDEIEMIAPVPTGEYLKREVLVQMDGGGQLTCLVYEISAAHAAGKPLIVSGDWVQNRDG